MGQSKSTLSGPRQRLQEVIDEIYFGKIETTIVNGEPDFSQPPKLTKEIKIGNETLPRHERSNADFELKAQFIDLFHQLDRLKDGSVVTIEVRHSLPARLI